MAGNFDKICKERGVDPEVIKSLKKKKKLPILKDIEYQKEVLQRMIDRGCKSCEKRRQEKYIESLENDQNN